MEEAIQWTIIAYLVYQVWALTKAVKMLLLMKKNRGVPKMDNPPSPPNSKSRFQQKLDEVRAKANSNKE